MTTSIFCVEDGEKGVSESQRENLKTTTSGAKQSNISTEASDCQCVCLIWKQVHLHGENTQYHHQEHTKQTPCKNSSKSWLALPKSTESDERWYTDKSKEKLKMSDSYGNKAAPWMKLYYKQK